MWRCCCFFVWFLVLVLVLVLFLGIFPVLVIVVTRVGERGVLFLGGVNLSFFVAG